MTSSLYNLNCTWISKKSRCWDVGWCDLKRRTNWSSESFCCRFCKYSSLEEKEEFWAEANCLLLVKYSVDLNEWVPPLPLQIESLGRMPQKNPITTTMKTAKFITFWSLSLYWRILTVYSMSKQKTISVWMKKPGLELSCRQWDEPWYM